MMAVPGSGQTNRIAYVDLRGQLCTVAPDGADPRTFEQPGRMFQFPTWAPSSNILTVVANSAGRAELCLVEDRPAAKPTILFSSADHRPFYLYWAPDERTISMLATHPTEGMGLHLLPVAGGAPHLLTTGQPCFWEWAPTADRLLVHTGVGGDDAQLRFLHLDGSSEYGGPHSADINPGLFQAPAIAPAGRLWAYVAATEGGNQLVVSNRTTTTAAVELHGAAAFSWSPTRNVLAFISPETAQRTWFGPLQVLHAETGAVRTLIDEPVLAFFWSPDGTSIAFLTFGEPPDPLVTSLTDDMVATNGHHTNGVAVSSRPMVTLELSVISVVHGRRRNLLSFQPTDLFLDQVLPYFDQYARSHRIWSPDSRSLVLPTRDAESMRIMVVPANGDPARTLADGLAAFWSHI